MGLTPSEGGSANAGRAGDAVVGLGREAQGRGWKHLSWPERTVEIAKMFPVPNREEKSKWGESVRA